MYNPFESPASFSQAPPSVQIEDYLDHLCAPLINKTTYEQRLAIRDEVRSHLLVLAAGHEELGSTPADAIQAAIDQFGNAKKIGCSLSSKYRKPFVLNPILLWYLLHAAVGGIVGSIAVLTTDCLVRQMGMTTNICVNMDFQVGFAIGWIPAIRLMKRPVSPLHAGIKTSVFYITLTTGLQMFAWAASGHPLDWRPVPMILAGLFIMGLVGALGGAAMPYIFHRLQRFAPPAKSQIAR
ncbi:MAG: hypothetical protein JWL77_2503 [Chthonomonadaceae bacterium]|nr:hypothetical protein [Chthonomonadaceae bacterium]